MSEKGPSTYIKVYCTCGVLTTHWYLSSRWKTPLNPFRGDPWRVTGVPTIIKVQDVRHVLSCPVSSYDIQTVQGIEVARLVEDEIVGELHCRFIGECLLDLRI